MQNIVDYMYAIRSHNILLWNKAGTDALELRYDKTIGFPEELREVIKLNKPLFKEILVYNEIYNEEAATKTSYYRIPFHLSSQQLTAIQNGIYRQSLLDDRPISYNIPIFVKLRSISTTQLIRAIQSTLAHHRLLRMTIKDDSHYEILPTTHYDIPCLTIKAEELNDYINQKAQHHFKLCNELLISPAIIVLENSDEVILDLTCHHILIDAYSVSLLINDVLRNYQVNYLDSDLIREHTIVDYFDYQIYQNYELQSAKYQAALQRLSARLTQFGPIQLTKLHQYKNNNYALSFDFEISSQVNEVINKLCIQYGLSNYALLATLLYHVLSIYSQGDNNFPLVLTVSNRPHELSEAIGVFINTQLLMFEYNCNETLLANISKANQEIMYLNEHRQLNLNLIAEAARIATPDILQLAQVMFTMHNFKEMVIDADQQLQFEQLTTIEQIEKFGISIIAQPLSKAIKFHVSYAANLYDSAYISQIFTSYQNTLNNLTESLFNQQISRLSLLSLAEYQQVVYDWNNTSQTYSDEITLAELFAAQVQQTPDIPALVYQDKMLSYSELDQRSNQLAHYLGQRYQPKSDDLFIVCLKRNEALLITILAVLKIGAAYVPVDSNLSEEKINYILQQTQAKAILTNLSLSHKFDFPKSRNSRVIDYSVEYIDSQYCHEQINSLALTPPLLTIKSASLAYVIFTSGTTGNPKGVMIEQKAIINTLDALQLVFKIASGYKIAAYANYTFDVSIAEFFVTLFNGGTLYLLDDSTRHDPVLIANYINNYQINYIYLPPVVLATLPQINFPTLKGIIYAGEPCSLAITSYWASRVALYNLYGPTEVSVYATLRLSQGEQHLIGRPLANVSTYILDNDLKPLPIGAVGELFIGGAGVARGYLNSEDLTQQYFIVNPFQTNQEKEQGKNARLYKTGDLVRYWVDGNLEYIGRNDFQVKLRGFRIELGEIESKLASYPGIKQAVVIVKELKIASGVGSDNKFLVAYYVAANELNEDEISAYLLAHLPEYMQPNVLVYLTKLPLTANGKLDRKELPYPQLSKINNYVAPRNELEQKVCETYAAVLGLQVAQVGVYDNFFKLGGNSILAIKLTNKLASDVDVKISVASLFKHKTIASLLNSQLDNDKMLIPRLVKREHRVRLSFAQERLWFIEQYEDGSNAYNIPFLIKLTKSVNITILEQAILAVVARHEVLHSLIEIGDDGYNYQIVVDLKQQPLLINKQQIVATEELKPLIKKEANYIFRLDQEYPIRIGLIAEMIDKLTVNSWYLSIVVHHIAFDGWSTEILLRDLTKYYQYYSQQVNGDYVAKLDLAELDIQYRDFAVWQRGYLNSPKLKQELAYWQAKLRGYEGLNLPLDKSRPAQVNYQGADLVLIIDAATSQQLRELAKQLQISLYSLLLSGFYLLLKSYTNQHDLIIGTPVANRHYQQLEDLIGFFVNNLVLRSEINDDENLIDYIKTIGKEVIAAQLHQDLSFEQLVEAFQVVKDPSRHPIFQVMFSLQSFGIKQQLLPSLFEECINEFGYNIAKFDLTVMIDDSGDELHGTFNYAISLFQEKTIANLILTYQHILRQLARLTTTSQIKIKELNYLDQSTYQQLIYNWNQTEQAYPCDKTIHQLFEEQVKITPDNVAVVYENIKLSYDELNQQANQLAHYLLNRYQIISDDLIGLCMDRSEQLLISLLAILKSGAAYVPMDSNYPDERISYILQDTKVKVLLINKIYYERLNNLLKAVDATNVRIEVIEELTNNTCLNSYSKTNPQVKSKSTDLAYVIYTSGTTGKPKGVALEHQGIVNRISWMNKQYPLLATDKVLQKTPYVFDVSVWELFWANWYGGCIVFARPEGHKDSNYLIKLIKQQQITILHFVPSMLEAFNLSLNEYNQNQNQILLPSLKYLFCSGEVLLTRQVEMTKQLLPQIAMYNLYGPTEASIDVLYYDCNQEIANKVAIGKPIANTTTYVLDSYLNPLPIGAIGELYVGGIGLARGYLNLANLTKERFIDNPFQSEGEKRQGKNTRIYKTGDLVRYLVDGNIEYIGRNDFQVKLRGFRIELGEIESKLSSYPLITQAVVMVKERRAGADTNENKYLVAYYVAATKLNEDEVLAYLAVHLPEYMLPNVLVYLTELPLTINGKLDRSMLPDPLFNSADNYVAPRSELEQKVCGVYAEVLGLDAAKVGIRDDFFRLGGDSIISIQLVSRLRQRLGLHLTVKDIFINKYVEKLCANVLAIQVKINAEFDRSSIYEAGKLSGAVKLLPIQEWFFSQITNRVFTKPGHWNQSFLIRTAVLDINLLKLSLVKLIEHHDGFRLQYKQVRLDHQDSENKSTKNSSYYQYYQDISHLTSEELAATIKINKINLKQLSKTDGLFNNVLKFNDSEEQLGRILTNWQDNFIIGNDTPLYSIGYIDGYEDNSARIFLALHHLLVDSISWRIIIHDLQTLYTKFDAANTEDELKQLMYQSSEELLGKKGTSYRQWAELISKYQSLDEKQIDYWSQYLAPVANYNKLLEALFEFGEKSEPNYAYLTLDKATTTKLLTQVNKVYHTEINDILLTGFSLALTGLFAEMRHKSAKIDELDHYISLEGHGREEIAKHYDVTNTIGWFTSMYPVCLPSVKSDQHQDWLARVIINIKESLRSIPHKGIGYGAIYGYTKGVLPRICFNYLGQFNSEGGNGAIITRDWQITGEASGISISPANYDANIINAHGLVIDGELKFTIATKLSQSMTQKFTNQLQAKLIEVIDYTSSHKRNYLTTSDITNIISEPTLNKIQYTKEINAVYLANSLQQGFIYHELSHSGKDTAYRVQQVFNYTEELNPQLLQIAWQLAIVKYPALRLRFDWQEELVQVVDNNQELEWHYHDLSNLSQAIQQEVIDNLIREDRICDYNLQHGNLIRIYLIKQETSSYVCIKSNHHAILDGWSNPVLLKFVHDQYQELKKKFSTKMILPHELVKLKQQLSIEEAYLASQQYLQTTLHTTNEFWQNELDSIEHELNLSSLLKEGKRSIDLASYRLILDRQEQRIEISNDTYVKLKKLGYDYEVTLNVILEYVWHRLLSLYGNSKTTIVGMSVSGRSLPIDNIEESVGLYTNTVPLIMVHNNEELLKDSLARLQIKINEIASHSNISLAKLHKGSRRLFSNLFIYENYPAFKLVPGSLHLSFSHNIEEVDYPLAVIVYENEGQIQINLKYAGELFAKESIANLLNTYQYLLSQIANSQPQQKVAELSYLDTSSYQQLVHNWNQTEQAYPHYKTIHQLFEEQVKITPNNIAVIHEEIKLSYRELNQQANQLAYYLLSTYQIRNDDLIAVCMDRSEQLLIALLAILKSGGAYVTIDPNYPLERINYILADTKTKLILTNKKHQARLNDIIHKPDNSINSKIEFIDNNQAKISTYPNTNPEIKVNSNNLAYVIYTSGTTGKPKGVMIEHGNVVSLVKGVTHVTPNHEDALLYLADISFDASTFELYTPLLNGARLVIPKNRLELLANVKLFKQYLLDNRISILWLTKTLFDQLYLMDKDVFAGIKYLLVGGEQLNYALIQQLLNSPNCPDYLINGYGPTENTTFSCSYRIINDNLFKLSCVPIGKPLANRTAYVLDSHLLPLPVGVIGELYVGGAGVARGYLNLTELTNERFVANPFQTNEEKEQGKNARLYKTGDLVRYQADGNIEYIGRNDLQVKLHGFRIELCEIESKLEDYPLIKQAVVVVKEQQVTPEENNTGGNKYLVGYYVAENKLAEAEILDHLSLHLPEYMRPTILMHLSELPVTANGKLDKAGLPDPLFSNVNTYVAPRNEWEQSLSHVYAEVLGLEVAKLGIYDDFFSLGGNSIAVIRLVGKLNLKYNIILKVADIYIHRNIAKLSTYINTTIDSGYSPLVKLNDCTNSSQLFMIHPGLAGCEVYKEFAKALAGDFSCYGIDSYNLYHEQKIADLNELANYYWNYIDEVMQADYNKQYILLGWSLGGQIALKIAELLEKRGCTDIDIILLDTFLPDLEMVSKRNALELKDSTLKMLTGKNIDDDYLLKLKEISSAETLISNTLFNNKLQFSRLHLFKAAKIMPNINDIQLYNFNEYLTSLADNNLLSICTNSDQLTIIDCHEAHHYTILGQEELLISYLNKKIRK